MPRRIVGWVVAAAGVLLAGASNAAGQAFFPPTLTAPGRMVFQAPGAGGAAGAGFNAGVAQADGRIVAATSSPFGALLLRLMPTGLRDSSFGDGGAVVIPTVTNSGVVQVLDRGGGRLLVVRTVPGASSFATPQLQLVGLTPEGKPDPAFGVAGVTQSPVQHRCLDACQPVAIAPDGSILVTGTREAPLFVDGLLVNEAAQTWIVARLRPDGAADPAFGDDGLATIVVPSVEGYGSAVAQLADGTIATAGWTGSGGAVTRLLANGTADPAFKNTQPVTTGSLPPTTILERPDRGLDLLAADVSGVSVVRVAVDGRSVTAVVRTARPESSALVPLPGGAELLIGVGSQPRLPKTRLTLQPIDAAGAPGPPLTRTAPFGGGRGSAPGEPFAGPSDPPVAQAYFRAAPPFATPGGHVVVTGSVVLAVPAGEEDGEQYQAAIAVLGADGRLDPAFGGPAPDPAVRIRIRRQRVDVTATPNALLPAQVAVRIAPSTPGFAKVRIRGRGALVARATIPLGTGVGENRYGVNLTHAGLGVLRRHQRVRVRATIRFRDIFGAAAPRRTATGVLRLGRIRCERC